MDFNTFIGQAWDDHVNAAQAVAERSGGRCRWSATRRS